MEFAKYRNDEIAASQRTTDGQSQFNAAEDNAAEELLQ